MTTTRRSFISGAIGFSAAAAFIDAALAATDADNLRINADRLRQSLEGLSVFGRPAGGTFSDGVSRVAFSDADVAGRKYAMDLMRAAGLDPRIDAAGSIFGERAGSDRSLKPILFGSHIDSVPSGGNFDGDLGSMAAIEVMRTLHDHNVATRHPLRMVIWPNEEGDFTGSGGATGALTAEDIARVRNGMSMADGIRRIGGDPDRLPEARIPDGELRCYLELHIEQGAILEKAGVAIGVVEGIVAIDEYAVEIRGFANHAGTTPMADRHNALLAAAKLIEAVQDAVTQEPGRQVGTVGQLEVSPNAVNVVPGRVTLSVELRDLSAEKIARLGGEIQKRAQEIAQQTGTGISFKRISHDPPALTDPMLQSAIESAAKGLGLKTMRMPSGAGHDAQMVAKIAPIGMIFVPSVGGISHSPKEFSRWQDCTNGANVLLRAILLLDGENGGPG